MNERPPVEASAAVRQGAKELRGVYIALVNEGFTEEQALSIIGHILAMQGKGRG